MNISLLLSFIDTGDTTGGNGIIERHEAFQALPENAPPIIHKQVSIIQDYFHSDPNAEFLDPNDIQPLLEVNVINQGDNERLRRETIDLSDSSPAITFINTYPDDDNIYWIVGPDEPRAEVHIHTGRSKPGEAPHGNTQNGPLNSAMVFNSGFKVNGETDYTISWMEDPGMAMFTSNTVQIKGDVSHIHYLPTGHWGVEMYLGRVNLDKLETMRIALFEGDTLVIASGDLHIKLNRADGSLIGYINPPLGLTATEFRDQYVTIEHYDSDPDQIKGFYLGKDSEIPMALFTQEEIQEAINDEGVRTVFISATKESPAVVHMRTEDNGDDHYGILDPESDIQQRIFEAPHQIFDFDPQVEEPSFDLYLPLINK